MKWIGLTGGIASGKSSVAAILRQHGFQVVIYPSTIDKSRVRFWPLVQPDAPTANFIQACAEIGRKTIVKEPSSFRGAL